MFAHSHPLRDRLEAVFPLVALAALGLMLGGCSDSEPATITQTVTATPEPVSTTSPASGATVPLQDLELIIALSVCTHDYSLAQDVSHDRALDQCIDWSASDPHGVVDQFGLPELMDVMEDAYQETP